MLALWTALVLAAAPAENVHRWVLFVEADNIPRTGKSIDETVREAARDRVGLIFLSPEEAFVEGGLEAQTGLSSCGTDEACLASRLRNVRAEYALLMVVRRVGAEYLSALRVVEIKSGKAVHRAVAQAQKPDQLAPAIAKSTAAAFDALQYPRGGQLTVTVQPANATLVLNDGIADRPLTAGRATLLAAKSYVVRAEAEDFEAASKPVELAAGTAQNVELVLAAREEQLTDTPWFWVGLGVAATAVGVGIAVIATGSDRCFCASADPNACGSCP